MKGNSNVQQLYIPPLSHVLPADLGSLYNTLFPQTLNIRLLALHKKKTSISVYRLPPLFSNKQYSSICF